jgi:hypothetical protein
MVHDQPPHPTIALMDSTFTASSCSADSFTAICHTSLVHVRGTCTRGGRSPTEARREPTSPVRTTLHADRSPAQDEVDQLVLDVDDPAYLSSVDVFSCLVTLESNLCCSALVEAARHLQDVARPAIHLNDQLDR